jgi:hypothetical protein
VNLHAAAALDRLVIAREMRTEMASGSSLSRARRSGRLIPLAHGLDLPAETHADLSPSDLALTRALAIARHGRTRRPLARASAALVWGVPLLGTPPTTVDVVGWSPSATRTAGALRYWGSRHPDAHLVEREGVQLTSLPRTLAEFASASTFAAGVVAVDWAVRANARLGETQTTVADIASVADELGMRRGRARLQRVLDFADGRSESPGESWSRVLMRRLGFVAPDLQVEVRGVEGTLFRADFGWRGGWILGEFDGKQKYVSTAMRGNRSPAEVVLSEKRREDSVRGTGRRVSRWDWSDLVRPRQLAAILEAAEVPRAR